MVSETNRPSRLPAASQAGVEDIAQGVAQEARPEEEHENYHPGEDCHPRRDAQVLTRAVEQVAEAWIARIDAEPKDGETRLDQDGRSQRAGGSHDDQISDVGEHVAPDDSHVAGTERLCGLDKGLPPDSDDYRPQYAARIEAAKYAEGQNQRERRCTVDGKQGDEQDQVGQEVDYFDHPVQKEVDAADVVG